MISGLFTPPLANQEKASVLCLSAQGV